MPIKDMTDEHLYNAIHMLKSWPANELIDWKLTALETEKERREAVEIARLLSLNLDKALKKRSKKYLKRLIKYKTIKVIIGG